LLDGLQLRLRENFLLDVAAERSHRGKESKTGLPPNYVPALMRGSRVKGPLLFWSEGVARTGALGMVK